MSTVYGSWIASDDYRARLDVSTSSTATAVTISATTCINTGVGYSSSGSGQGNCTVNGSTASKTGINFSQNSNAKVTSKSATINKTHSSQTIACSGQVWSTLPAYGSAKSTASTNVTVPALASYTITYKNNGHGTAPSSQTKWYGESLSLRGAISATGYTFKGWNTKADGSGTNYAAGASYTGNAALTLYAKWQTNTYTITPNGNGGTLASGCAALTKTYGVAKALWGSSLNPTRSGWTFLGWGTSASTTTVSYKPGASYTANAAATLYALWSKTISVTYNANSGTGAPTAQSKTIYNATTSASFTVPTSKPTRTGYSFLGWATSSTATSADTAYDPGDTFSRSANLILYAVWRADVPNLTINNVWRADSTGTVDDEGTYVKAKVTWSQVLASTLTITVEANGNSITTSGTTELSGTNEILLEANLSTDSSYTVTVSATNEYGTKTLTKNLGTAYYPMEVLAGGHGVAFGKVASTPELLDVGYNLNVDGEVSLGTVLDPTYGGTGHTSLQATRNAMGLGNTTGVLPTANGGTGNANGTVAKLTTARSLYVNLASVYNSSSPVTFDGSANKALPITGALPIANGGTGKTSAADARAALGAAHNVWTSLGSVSGTTSLTINLTNYNEVLITCRYSTTYLASIVLPKAGINASTQWEIYLGGWGNNTTTSNRRAVAKLSRVKFTPVAVTTDQTDRTSSATWVVYAR